MRASLGHFVLFGPQLLVYDAAVQEDTSLLQVYSVPLLLLLMLLQMLLMLLLDAADATCAYVYFV